MNIAVVTEITVSQTWCRLVIIIIIIVTSFATISSKIKLSGATKNQGINQSHNRKQCVSRQRMDGKARRLRRIGSIKEIGF